MKKKLIFLVTVAILIGILMLTSYALTNVTKSVPSSGMIVSNPGVGVYSDSACTIPLSTIAWGNISVGGTATYQFYVKNTGYSNTTLSMTTSSWSPTTASQYITISWDKNNVVLTPSQVVQATLTLSVSPSIGTSITSFSNNIIVTGSG